MASIYTVDKKHIKYFNINSNDVNSSTGNYEITQSLFNKWLKVDTSTEDITLLLPSNLYKGFHCVIENIGSNKITYLTPNNINLKTDEENCTDTRYRSVEVNFDKDNSEWRIQGYIGIDNINSIYDVKTNQDKAPEDKDCLTFDETTGFWKAANNPPFLTKRNEVITSDFSIDNKDHNEFIITDTTNNPINVAINLGLAEGLHLKIMNISNGYLNLNVAGTLIGPDENIYPNSYFEVHHLKNDVYYSTIVGK